MLSLSVRLFSKLHVQRNEQALVSLDASKTQELFCYLLLHRDRPHPRETLAGLLWGDSTTAQSKKYLRQALWQLQAALNPRTDPIDSPVLLVESDWVQLNPEADLWLDVALFEQTFELVRGVPGQTLDTEKAHMLQGAANLYRGDLLEGWYQDWCLYERERLRNMYLAMLGKLMSHCEAQGKYEDGVYCGECALRCDVAQERIHRRLMRLRYLAGDRTAAVRQFERCVAVLDEELGVRPSKQTLELFEQIRADRLNETAPIPDDGSAALQGATEPLPQVLERLEELRAVLDDVQLQVDQEIRAVRQILKTLR